MTLQEKKDRLAELIKGQTPIKCDYQKMYEAIESGDVKAVKMHFYGIFEDYEIPGEHSGKVVVNELAQGFLDVNNKNVYLQTILDEWKETSSKMGEEEKLNYEIFVEEKELA